MALEANNIYDICIIGGGINGAGIARDAAGRGLKILLLEQGDLASSTSSASTKLIHGGLRYLEYYEFRLVREALKEREVLLRIAPHIIWPMKFILPDAFRIRPFWLIRAGLLLYDLLSLSFHARKFPLSQSFNLQRHIYGAPLKDDFLLAVLYSDGWVQDSRLVVLNAMDARSLGADILTRTKCTKLVPENGKWTIDFENEKVKTSAVAKIVVNAAGPWAETLLKHSNLTTDATPTVRLVQGSHIIIPRLYEGDQAYMLQQPDKRIVFVIPYEGKFTLIGTTDTDYHGEPDAASITEDEIVYLLNASNHYFQKQIERQDIVKTYSGVRPLLDDEHGDAKKVTRDYKIHENDFNGSHLISVFGGKITTYRKLSEKVMRKISSIFNIQDKSWTGKRFLPGGDIPSGDIAGYLRSQKIRWENENAGMLKRYLRNYGTKMVDILSMPKGEDYGDDVYEAEIRYLIRHEFAMSLEDIIWRRSKLELSISPMTKANLEKALPRLLQEASL